MTANFATVLGVENVSRPLDQTLITAAPTSASSELPVAIEIAGPIEPVVLALAIIAPRNMVVDNRVGGGRAIIKNTKIRACLRPTRQTWCLIQCMHRVLAFRYHWRLSR